MTNGDFYATTLAERLGVAQSGGWVRVGLAPYVSEPEAARAIAAISRAASLARQNPGPTRTDRAEHGQQEPERRAG